VSNVAISARSVDDKYFLSSNFFSSSNICLPVKVVRAFFFFFFCVFPNKSPSSLFEIDRQRSINQTSKLFKSNQNKNLYDFLLNMNINHLLLMFLNPQVYHQYKTVLYDYLLTDDIFHYNDIYDDLMAYLKIKMAMMMNNVDKDHLLILASLT